MQVFISYAKEDYETAKKLYDDLGQQHDVRPWMDRADILIGQDWQLAIRQAIQKIAYFLALLSSNSVSKKGYVQKELRMALDILDEIPPMGIFILPVRLNECQPNHERLRRIHWGELFPCYETGLSQILRTISAWEKPDEPVTEKTLAANNGKEIRKENQPKIRLRSEPHTLLIEDVKAMLAKFNFFDKRWNKSGNFKNDFKDNSDGTVSDRVTGLMWQKAGSDNYMPYKKMQAYIDKLNQEKFAGYGDWRLPTTEELASLLENEKRNGDLYIDPVFDKEQWGGLECRQKRFGLGVGRPFPRWQCQLERC